MRSSKPTADRAIGWRCALLTLYVSGLVHAYPDASPWGSANPGAEESCSSCHNDFDPVLDSDALELTGIPAFAFAGQRYDVVLRFDAGDAEVAGFQAVSTAGDFTSEDGTLEPVGTAIRSTRVRNFDDGVEWRFSWQAPDASDKSITMYIAASAANGDQSPLGDTIHYRQIELSVTR